MRAIRLIRTFGQESYICRRYCALQSATNDVAVEASTEETPKKSTKKVKVPRNAKVPTNIHDATKIVKENARAKFDETVEMIVNLDVDPRKQNQVVKGVASLPSGLGKTTRVAVFAVGGDIQAALAAGADVAGGEDLIQTVQAGKIDFDRVIATPEIMSKLSKIGRILGPKGLMPTPKMGTVTTDVAKAVKSAKAGVVSFKVDKTGIIHAGIGKVSFSVEALIDNIRSLLMSIGDARPEGLKGKYFKSAYLTSTQGQSVLIDLSTVDPNSPKFMLDRLAAEKLGFQK